MVDGRAPDDPKAWLITTAWRRFIDVARAEAARRSRELRTAVEDPQGPTVPVDDTLQLYFLCAHPSLSPASAVALTLRAVGGLTTRQIARAYLVPESTMAQRISRAKRTVSEVRLNRLGNLGTVLRVLYLVFNEGYTGDVDLSAEAIRLARQLAAATDAPEVAGLLALFLLHDARRPARTRADGTLVPLAEQDRTLWRHDLITEGVAVLQAALAATGSGSTRHRPRSPRCTPTRGLPTKPTGCRSSSGTTNSLPSPTAPSRASTVRWQWVRPTGRVRVWRPWPSSTRRCRAIPRRRHICTNVPATSRVLPSCTSKRPTKRIPCRSEITCCSRPPRCISASAHREMQRGSRGDPGASSVKRCLRTRL